MTIILDGTTGITTPTTSTTGEFVTSVTGFKNRIIQRRKKAEMEAAMAKAKKRQQIMEAVSMAFWISIFLVAIGLSYFFTTLFLERRA